jgi:hypothetical protein
MPNKAPLNESEKGLRRALDLSPDGFTILRPLHDEHGKIIDFTWVYENATTCSSCSLPRNIARLF